ncbi:helix-turn-helix domain-containing protein [Pseudidiomarina sp. E22-M8]|uniref:helix-turn-helix domain-containing protein n=1 Tax=Pseudidiomarina sp. E22-M8 TaxID=3424768 RepID=UPI00403C61A1
MKAVDELHQLLGELIKRHRAQRMDQRELAMRIGCSQRTLTRIEQGQPVNSETIFTALAVLGQLHDFVKLADEKVRAAGHLPERKSSVGKQGLDNDF